MVICQNCGSEVKDEARFCNNCGSEIIREEAAAEEVKTMYCRNCGFKMDKNLKYCPECGSPTSNAPKSVNHQVVNTTNKSAGLAAVLSFLIIGLGQVYIGLTKKGIILFVAAIVSGILMLFIVGWILWLLVWGYAIYDAYNSAEKLNNGIPVEDTLDFNNLF